MTADELSYEDEYGRPMACDGVANIIEERLGRSINEIKGWIEYGWLDRTDAVERFLDALRDARLDGACVLAEQPLLTKQEPA